MLASIDETKPIVEDPLASIDLGEPISASIVPEIASERANKIQLAFPGTGRSYEQTYSQLLAGREPQLRIQTAAEVDANRASLRQRLIAEAARAKGAALGPEDIHIINNYTDNIPSDPASIFEEGYAKFYTNQLRRTEAANPGTILHEANRDIPADVRAVMNLGSTHVSKIEFAKTALQDAEHTMEQQSGLSRAGDFLKGFIPFYREVKLRSKFTSLLGTDLDEQGRALLRLPFEEYKTKLTEIMTKLKRDNPELAVAFARAVIGMSTADITLNNAFSAVEPTALMGLGIGGLVGRVARAASMRHELNGAMKNLIKSTESPEAAKVAMATGAGDIGEAAVVKATSNIVQDLSATTPEAMKGAVKQAVEVLPQYLRAQADEVLGNTGTRVGARELVNRISEETKRFTNNFMYALANVIRVRRIPAVQATEEATRALKETIKDNYPGLNNRVLDVGDILHNPLTNTYHVEMKIGQRGAELFMRHEDAVQYAKQEGILAYRIDKQGLGHFITVTKPLDETQNVIRDFLLTTANSKAPTSWTDYLRASFIRTPEDVVSKDNAMNRKAAVYGTSVLTREAQDQGRYIRDLARGVIRNDPVTGEAIPWWRNRPAAWVGNFGIPGLVKSSNRRRWEDWDRMVRHAKDADDPITKEKGYFFRSVHEIEDFYQRTFQRMPQPVEIEAYFAHKRLIEMDAVLRDLAIYKSKSRVGTESHRFFTTNKAGERIHSEFFDGVIRKELPSTDDNVLILGKRAGNERVRRLEEMSPQQRGKLKEDIKEGRKAIVEVYDPELRPFSTYGKVVGNDRVRYVIADAFDTKPIPFEQLPRRGGGHFEYDHDFYIKQAIVRPDARGRAFKHWYEGDITIMPMGNRALAQDVAKHLDEVRKLLLADETGAAATYARLNIAAIEWKQVKAWFEPSKLNGVDKPALLSLNEPIQVVPRDKMIVTMNKDLENRYPTTFKDGTRQGSLARQYQVQYTQERDARELFTVKDVGTRHNPIYQREDAKFIDPIPSMDRALTKIINSTFLDDYKIFSVEHWIQGASKYLRASDSELRYSPFWHFNYPEWKAGVDETVKSNFQAQRWQIQQLLGIPSKTDSLLFSAANKLADITYKNLGPNAAIVPMWLVPKLRDPLTAIRSFTFDAKLGLFAIPQLLVQSQTYAAIYGIAGYKYAGSGSMATLLHQWARHNRSPEVMAKLDELATKFRLPGMSRWKAGEWRESVETMERTGLNNVAGEYMMLDRTFQPQIVQNAFGSFLDAGRVFFREGERNVRIGAWHTAFREFRDKFPTGRITQENLHTILQRADTLTVNMSRASSSLLHTGILQFPMQFLSYQIRSAELFLGKRLGETASERALARARLMGWYSAIYGVPTSLALTGFPAGDFIRKAALDHGYEAGDNVITPLMEGLVAYGLAFASGGGNVKKGNWYNVSELGSQGFEPIREALRGDKTFMELAGGAAFSTMKGIWDGTDGLMKAVTSLIRDDGEMFPHVANDYIDAARELSSVHTAARFMVAINTGRWLSKKGAYLTDVTPINAAFMSLTRTSPTGVGDMHLMSWNREQQIALHKEGFKKASVEYRRGIQAYIDNNPTQGQAFLARSRYYLDAAGYPEARIPQAYAMMNDEHKSLIERMDDSYFLNLRNIPKGREDDYLRTFGRREQMRENRRIERPSTP